jgi:putative oxidoreductase
MNNSTVNYSAHSDRTSQHSALALRLTLGTILLAHGLLKVLVFTVPGTVGFFAGLGLPPVAAYLTIFGELAGGIALLLGVYSRLVALLSLPILLGATWAHIGNGWVFNNTGGGWEYPLLLTVLAAIVLVQGGGSLAIRRLPLVDNLIPAALRA